MNGFFTTDTMLWVAQISLACILFYAAFSKAFPRRASAMPGGQELIFACDGMPCGAAYQCFCLSNDRVAWHADGRTVRFIP